MYQSDITTLSRPMRDAYAALRAGMDEWAPLVPNAGRGKRFFQAARRWARTVGGCAGLEQNHEVQS